MRSRRNLPVFLAYAVASVLVLLFLVSQMGGQITLGGTYRVNADFQTAADLVPGDDVTMAGVRVGKVASLTPIAHSARAVLSIDKRYAPLFSDARAVIRLKNLLGEAYVDINRGQPGQGQLSDGGTIDEDHTLTPVEVDQVLNALDPQVRDRLDILINSLGEATAGRGADMNASASDVKTLSADLAVIARSLAANSDHLDALIHDLRKVMETLAAWHVQFRALIADWDHVMATLASRQQALQGTISEQDRVMAIFDQALAGSAPSDLHAAVAGAPSALGNANHYLSDAATVFGVMQKDTPQISQLFREMATVMAGSGVADEGASPDHGEHVNMWRVYCSGACFR